MGKAVKRGMILLLTVVLLLSLSVLVTAYSKKIFDETMTPGTSLDIDDYTIIITLNYGEDRVFVDGGDDFASINKGNCGTLKNIKVCFTGTEFDEDELKTYMNIEVYKREPVISITRTLSKTEFYTGEEVTVKVKVENTGDFATDATYYENWGSEFEITEMEEGPCSIERSAIIWKGHVSETRPLECTFKIEAKQDVKKSVVGKLKYHDGYKYVEKYSTELIADVNPILGLETRVVGEDEEPIEDTFNWEADDTLATVGEEFNLAMILANMLLEDRWVDVDVTLSYPESLEYKGQDFIVYKQQTGTSTNGVPLYNRQKISGRSTITEKGSNTLHWKGRLNNEPSYVDTEKFVLSFLAKKSGMSNIFVVASCKDEDGHEFVFAKYVEIEVKNKALKPYLYISDPDAKFVADTYIEEDETKEIESLNEYRIRVQLDNLNGYSKIKNVKVNVETELSNFTNKAYDIIDSGGSIIPYSFVFTAPRTDSDKTYPLKIIVSGETEYDEQFTNETEYEIDVKAFQDVEINHEFESTSIMGDEETNLMVTLTNNRLIDIKKIKVWDEVDPRFKIEGVHARELNLKPDEETEVYHYELIGPNLENEEKLKIKTHVTYFDPDHNIQFNHTKESDMTVEPKELVLTTTRDIDDDGAKAGAIVDITYEFTNSEDTETITNLKVKLPLSKDYEIIGSQEYTIEKLAPGETYTLKDRQKIRLRVNKNINIPSSLIEYHDVEGRIMHDDTGEDTINIDEEEYSNHVAGPKIKVERTIDDKIYVGEPARVTLSVVNEGDSEQAIEVIEENETYSIKIPAGSERLITYRKNFTETGEYEFGNVIIRYNYQMQPHTTLESEPLKIKIEERPEEFVEIKEEKKDENPEEIVIEEEKEEVVNEKKIDIQFIVKVILMLVIIGVVVAYFAYQIKSGPAPPVLEE